MYKLFSTFILVLGMISLTGCGGSGSLETLRQERRVHKEEVIPLPFAEVRKNILRDRTKNLSPFRLYENPDDELISLVALSPNGGIICFMDFKGQENTTKVKVYQWFCSEREIQKAINSAR